MTAYSSVEMLGSMATKKDQWDHAFSVLDRFERQIFQASDLSWSFLVEQTGISKPTLWRNSEFKSEFQRVRELVRGYATGSESFDIVSSVHGSRERAKDLLIVQLKEQINNLTSELNRERERLIYACMVARRRNIDPMEFMDLAPLGVEARPAVTTTPIKKVAKDSQRPSLNKAPESE